MFSAVDLITSSNVRSADLGGQSGSRCFTGEFFGASPLPTDSYKDSGTLLVVDGKGEEAFVIGGAGVVINNEYINITNHHRPRPGHCEPNTHPGIQHPYGLRPVHVDSRSSGHKRSTSLRCPRGAEGCHDREEKREKSSDVLGVV